MRTENEIEKELSGLEAKLVQIDEQKAQNMKKINEIKQSNIALLETSIGRKRQPAALNTQRTQIARLQLELDELSEVKPRVEAKLDETRKELKVSKLYYENVQLHETQEIEFMGRWHELETLVNDLLVLPNPLAILRNLLSEKGLGRECSLPAFFDGKIEPPDGDKNASFLERRLDQYRSIKNVLPVLGRGIEDIEGLIQGVQEHSRRYLTRPPQRCLLCSRDKQTGTVQSTKRGMGPLQLKQIREENEARFAAQRRGKLEKQRGVTIG